MLVQVLRTVDDISCIREEWEHLWQNQIKSCPYESVDWITAWITSNSIEKRLNILFARDVDGTLIGVAPLQRVPLIVPGLAALTFIGQESSISPDFLVAAGREEEFCDAVLRYVSCSKSIKAIVLKMADPCHGASPLLRGCLCGRRSAEIVEEYSQRPIINLPESYERFLEGLSSKMRQEMRAARRNLAKCRNMELSCDGGREDFASRMAELFTLNDLRWGKSGGRRVYESLYPKLYDSGMLKIFILYVDGHPAAGVSTLLAGDSIYAELAGFDYNVESRYLGKCFYGLIIEWVIQNGYRSFDFSSGSDEYKLRFKPEIYPKYRMIVTGSVLGRLSLVATRTIGKYIGRFQKAAIA